MIAGPTARVVALLIAGSLAAPALAAPRCGAPPPDGAPWFYLGEPGGSPHAAAARDALRAVLAAFEGATLRDPRCLRVQVHAGEQLGASARRLSRHALPSNTVGFHNPRLGADSTVFVTPNSSIPLAVVMVHEVLHALSHRFSSETQRRRLHHMNEGATQYITRSIVVSYLGHKRDSVRSGYDAYVQFYEALLRRLGGEGSRLLAEAYLSGGYDSFERDVDSRLGLSLRSAAQALERDDLAAALQRIGER